MTANMCQNLLHSRHILDLALEASIVLRLPQRRQPFLDVVVLKFVGVHNIAHWHFHRSFFNFLLFITKLMI